MPGVFVFSCYLKLVTFTKVGNTLLFNTRVTRQCTNADINLQIANFRAFLPPKNS